MFDDFDGVYCRSWISAGKVAIRTPYCGRSRKSRKISEVPIFPDDDGARRADLGGPPWAQTRPRRGPLAGRAWGVSGRPSPPLTEILRVYHPHENLRSRGTERSIPPPLRGGKYQRKALQQVGICRGNSLPEGEIDAIVTAITLDFIRIIIITISTIISSLILNHMMSRE